MVRKILGIVFFAALALSACKVQSPQPQVETPAAYPSLPAEVVENTPAAYPGIEVQPVQAYPGPGDFPVEPVFENPAYLSPQPGDENLERSIATVEMQDSELLILESYPIQVVAVLHGYMPNPCHQLRAEVGPADAENKIQIDVYSVVDANMICTEVIAPFDVRMPLGSYQGAKYQFFVNGELLGEVDS